MNFPHIQTVVMARHEPACRELSIWLSAMGLDWRYGSPEFGVDVARNQNVWRFLRDDVPRGKTHLLMIDADMVPVRETEEILYAAGDVVYCGYADRDGTRGHYGDGDFGAGCFRASAHAMRRIGQPWFVTSFDDHRRCRAGCECYHFRQRAINAGVEPKMVGVIGHAQRCILLPAPDSRHGWQLMWPSQFAIQDGSNDVRRMLAKNHPLQPGGPGVEPGGATGANGGGRPADPH